MQMFLVSAVALVAVAAQTTYDCPDESCVYPAGCKKNITINSAGIDVSKTPFYDQIISEGYDHDYIDNACNTFFPFKDGSLLYCRYVTYNNGTSVLHRYLYVLVQGYLGIYRGQGLRKIDGCDTCVYTDYILGEVCPGSYVLYRCYNYGVCEQRYAGRDIRFGFSSPVNVTDECKKKMYELGTSGNPGLEGSELKYLPNKLEKKCAASWNGMKCVNYERIPCEYRVDI